ncbi:MAG: hypothetical protein HZC17_05090, partial [Candidatus Omnitrophica bacterium]|nr:hypothetical protein [Candidatus Omnitrophota bacterium]
TWDEKTQTWILKASSLGAAPRFDDGSARDLYHDLLMLRIIEVQKLQAIITRLGNEDSMIRVQAVREMEELGKRSPEVFSEKNLEQLLALLSPQNLPNVRKTARTAMEVFGEVNPKAFTEKNYQFLDRLLPVRGYRSDRHNIVVRYRFHQKRAEVRGNSLGSARVQDEEVIIHVAIEAADHLLYQGDLTQERLLNRALGIRQAAAQVLAPSVDLPLEYILAKLGVPAEQAKRRAVVVTQDLVKNPEVRSVILDNLKKGDRVIAVKNPILESEKYYDQFLKAARARGIEVVPFTNVSGIRPVELERRLRNIQDSFSAESALDRNSIPAVKKDHFSRFKIDEAALNRGNVSVKLAMETIMALALVDQESVYKAAGFQRRKDDGFWHVDNSFVEFMQSLSREYQADQIRKKAA